MSFLQIKAKHKGQIKNASDQKTDSTLLYQLFKTRNFVYRPNMHFLTKIILIMGDIFYMKKTSPIIRIILLKIHVWPIDKVSSFEKLIK